MKVYFLLSICFGIYKAEYVLHYENSGVNISYTISSLSACRPGSSRFHRFMGVTLPECVTECGLRPHCRSLTYLRKMNVCDLFETADIVESVVYGSCIYISSSDIQVQKKPCEECGHSQVCDVLSKQCIYKECPVKVIENGFVLGNMYLVGSKTLYSCKQGFTNIVKGSVSVCQNSGTWSTDAECIRDCGPLSSVDNGHAMLTSTTTTIDSSANISCNAGYETSKDVIHCTDSGWEATTCIKKDCGSIYHITGGTASPVNGSTTFESTAEVLCIPGYESDKFEIKCQDTGEWETSVCAKRDCGGNFQIVNGNAVPINGSTTFGSKANVTCNANHESEKAVITCLESGEWETAECVKLVYKLVRTNFAWEGAKINCESLGGRLADIKSPEEQDAIESLLPAGHQSFWIGGRFNQDTDSFEWLDGSKISDGFTRWGFGEPNQKPGENVIMLEQKDNEPGYEWHDAPSKWNIGSVCEFD